MKLVNFGLVALLWSYGMIYGWLLTLTAVFRCLESVEEQAANNGLLFNLVVPSVSQGRQWGKLNQDIQDVKGTQATTVHSVIVLLVHAQMEGVDQHHVAAIIEGVTVITRSANMLLLYYYMYVFSLLCQIPSTVIWTSYCSLAYWHLYLLNCQQSKLTAYMYC